LNPNNLLIFEQTFNMKSFLVGCIILFLPLFSIAQLESPEDFLVTDYGKQFTPHHYLVDYVEHVSENSSRVEVSQYGITNEDRPLLLCYISTPENLEKLDAIRQKNLYNIGMSEETSTANDLSIVWLSFSVHGNEAGGSEASMTVLHQLASGEFDNYLSNTVVLLDPSVNPDGYSRYSSWVRAISGKETHPELSDREHMEPWPGGRVNHYLFDLNRDWAWQTQVETQQRIKVYNEWMPHVHVDLHEMGYNNHYYFAPAAEPFHKYISDFQRSFQVDIGQNHAKYFDENGWLYFTRETFDLFYPSYGDTYPTFNGAIGMTYEQAGHGMAGRAIDMNNGDVLKLQDRIDHHTTTALSTIEVASKNNNELVSQFKSYFKNAQSSPPGNYKGYVVKASPSTVELAELLNKNGIRYTVSESERSLSGFDFNRHSQSKFQLAPGDIVIDAYQPKSVLLQVLMEPSPELSDSLTYDITSWALPYAYGVQAYGLSSAPVTSGLSTFPLSPENAAGGDDYAYVIPPSGMRGAKAIAQLSEDGYKMRLANKAVRFGNLTVERGSVVLTKTDNFNKTDLENAVRGAFGKSGYDILRTGFSSNGGDLGGSSFSLLNKPKVLLLSGEQTSHNGVGQVWHYFEEDLDYPLSIVNLNRFGRIDLDDYNVLILPDGYYRLSEDQMNTLSSWVRNGGKVIAIAGALNSFGDTEGFSLSKYLTDEDKKAAESLAKEKEVAATKESYEDQERRRVTRSLPGAIVKNGTMIC